MDTQEKSMIVENILACLMTKKVLYKVQKCKNWPHNFFVSKFGECDVVSYRVFNL